ncbi:MAG: DNA repair protein RadC [Crocinitomix sp.]|nr:DNA repair protein RadC [Crocinitomix sp.]
MSYLSLKNLPADDRPREKLMEHGRKSLSNAEIVGILIGSGTREKSAVQLSRDILHTVDNSLDRLARLTVHDLMKFKGIGQAKAVSIAAALELGRRKGKANEKISQSIRKSRDIYKHVKDRFEDLGHEEFYAVLLNRSNKVQAIERISVGGISGTSVDGKVIFKKAIEQSASGVVLCHNHPSGNLNPSRADIELTKKLVNFGRMIEMPILDHLIITDKDYFSFADQSILT